MRRRMLKTKDHLPPSLIRVVCVVGLHAYEREGDTHECAFQLSEAWADCSLGRMSDKAKILLKFIFKVP